MGNIQGIIGQFVQLKDIERLYYNVMDKVVVGGDTRYLGVDHEGKVNVFAPMDILHVEDKEVVDKWVQDNTIIYEVGVMNRDNWKPLDIMPTIEEAHKFIPEQPLTQGSIYVIRVKKGELITVAYYWVWSTEIDLNAPKGTWQEYKENE